MLFNRNIEPRCAYCAHAAPIGHGEVACLKKGVVSQSAGCRRFKYDPLKRTPPRPSAVRLGSYKSEDFSIE